MVRYISRAVVGALSILLLGVMALSIFGGTLSAATPSPSTAETARLLGYMWGDGTFEGGVWDVNGPSGTSSLIEELVEEHGGIWTNRQKLQFRLPAPYDWTSWKDGLPDDDADVREAVSSPHFLAAVMETEASVGGQIYDQSQCCVPGYTRGRLTQLRDLLRDRGFSTATLVEFGNVDSGKITVDASEWAELRGSHRFVCPVQQSDIRLPGGTDYNQYGNIRWFGSATRWSSLVRNDCTSGGAVPPVQPQVGTCSVTVVNGDEAKIDWTFTLGEASIRRDGQFEASVSARDGSYSESPGDGSFSYEVRLQAFGEQTTAPCGAITIGAEVDGPCSVTAVAGGVRVAWDDFGRERYSVRRNGSWVASVSDGSTFFVADQGTIGDVWTVRYRVAGAVTNVPCESGQPPVDGPCAVTTIGAGVNVNWDDIAGDPTYQVRRNGKWLASVSGESQYDHVGGTPGDTYTVRYRQNGATTDIPCSA